MSDIQQLFGQQGLTDQNSRHHAFRFLSRQSSGLMRTAVPVQVVAVHGGGVGPPPTVDVLPLVNQIDGGGVKTEHVTLYGLPVARNQGGLSAIINDPKVNDFGWVTVGDRDHSAVIRQAAQANPGSFRRHSLSDGVYTACLALKVTPTQYLIFDQHGLRLVDDSGNILGFQNSNPYIYLSPNNNTSRMVYLGGDGKVGTYDFVQTASGPSVNVKARIG